MRTRYSLLATLAAAAAFTNPLAAQSADEWKKNASCILHTTILENTAIGERNPDEFSIVAAVDSTHYRISAGKVDVDLSSLTATVPDSIVGERTLPLTGSRMYVEQDGTMNFVFEGVHSPFKPYVQLDMRRIGRFAGAALAASGRGDAREAHGKLFSSLVERLRNETYSIPCEQSYQLQQDSNRYITVTFSGTN